MGGQIVANGVFWVVGNLPLSAIQYLGRFVGRPDVRLPGSYKRRARVNLQIAMRGAGVSKLAACLRHVGYFIS